MRIQKTHKRYISSVVAGLMVTAITLTGFSYNDKTVTVMADGAAHTVKTHLNSNEGIVRNAGIKLNPKDKVISDSNSVQEGTTLTVVRAFPVSVTVNGKTRTVYTTQTTAEDLAEELGFKAPNYTTAASGAIQAGSTVNIVRVTSRAVNTVDQEIPVQVIRQKDDTMAQGEEEVVQVGQPGTERVQVETLYNNGTAIRTNELSKSVMTNMVPTIIKEGTREVTTSRNVSGRASRSIAMEASAYLAGDGDGAGITATGIPAVRGVVAVDPDVIPLGTRLFIPGYGEAVAADTGGAIVGNRIDLVMDSYGEAMDFGRRDVTVYVLD